MDTLRPFNPCILLPLRNINMKPNRGPHVAALSLSSHLLRKMLKRLTIWSKVRAGEPYIRLFELWDSFDAALYELKTLTGALKDIPWQVACKRPVLVHPDAFSTVPPPDAVADFRMTVAFDGVFWRGVCTQKRGLGCLLPYFLKGKRFGVDRKGWTKRIWRAETDVLGYRSLFAATILSTPDEELAPVIDDLSEFSILTLLSLLEDGIEVMGASARRYFVRALTSQQIASLLQHTSDFVRERALLLLPKIDPPGSLERTSRWRCR